MMVLFCLTEWMVSELLTVYEAAVSGIHMLCATGSRLHFLNTVKISVKPDGTDVIVKSTCIRLLLFLSLYVVGASSRQSFFSN